MPPFPITSGTQYHNIFTIQPPSLFGRMGLTPSAFLSCCQCKGAKDIFFLSLEFVQSDSKINRGDHKDSC